MAATPIIAPTADAANTAAVITVADGASVTLALYVAAGELTQDCGARVALQTPGAEVVVGYLNKDQPVINVAGPGEFHVRKGASPDGTAFGVSQS